MSTPAGGAVVVPAPPDPIDCAMFTLEAGTIVHRIHDQDFAAAAFNPGFGESRFAPFEVAGVKIPTQYAGTTLACAIFESIFHDIEPSAPIKSVGWSVIDRLHYSTIALTRDLKLARLFAANLSKWGLARTDLIDTPKSTYDQTRLWSPALHQCPRQPEGMIWVSRRYDEEKAMILFGDRVDAADLAPQSTVKVTSDIACMNTLVSLAEDAGIDIIRY